MGSFAEAWDGGDAAAVALLARPHRDAAGRREVVARASRRGVHPAVLEALTATTPAQRAHREALAQPGAVAVVTGQQAGLFGGPLYTVYKAASAVVNARALADETGAPCVPVFWLQSEDHDYDEIASCASPSADGVRTFTVPGRPDDDRRSVGARQLGEGVAPALEALADVVQGLSDAGPALDLLRAAWRPDRSPVAAFRAWIEALFADRGLLVVDPRHPAIVAAARPVHEIALRDAQRHTAALAERAAALEAAGWPAQVHVRPGSPLCFVHPDGLDGPRYRVDPDGDGFRLVGADRRVDRSALGACSTSALLRPILQDTLLPTAAYVGGPGEIAYFAQLPPLYDAYGLSMPMIVPRARVRVVDDTAARCLEQLGLRSDEIATPGVSSEGPTPREALLARLLRPPAGAPTPEALLAALVDPAHDALARFAGPAEALDPALAKAADKTRAAIDEASARLVDRYRKALGRADQTVVDRLDRLLGRLQPGGAPQERVFGWPWYGARYGVQGFVDAVFDGIAPFDGALRELRP